MEKRKSFIIHIDTLDVLDELNTEQKASLFDAIRDYHLGNEVKLSGLMRAVFIAFENQFKRDENKYLATTERNRENGKKGGRPNEDRVSKSLSGKTIPKHSDSHWVYLLQDDDSGEIKIGETQNLYNRRQTIKRSSYHLVYIDFFEVKDLSTALKIESEFKNEFKINYLNGDWFNMSNLDIEKAIGYLKTHPLIEKAKKPDSDSDNDNDNDSVNDSDNVNDSKKEKKEIRAFAPPSLEEFMNEVLEHERKTNRKIDITEAKSKFYAWEADGWKDGNGKQIKNWKAKIAHNSKYWIENASTSRENSHVSLLSAAKLI